MTLPCVATSYLHVYWWLDGPVTDCRRTVDRFIAVLGSSVKLTPAAAISHAIDHHRPGPGWSKDDMGDPVNELRKCGVESQQMRSFLDRIPPDTGHVLFNAPRRGSKDRLRDYDWSFQYTAKSTTDVDFRGAMLGVTISPRLLRGTDARALVEGLVDVASKEAVLYGLVHADYADETNGSTGFGPNPLLPLGNRFAAEEWAWRDPDLDRSIHVRGVFWGNYLGPAAVGKLQAQRDRLGEFERWRYINDVGRDSSAHRVRRYASGAVFITLTENPLDALPGGGIGCNFGMYFEGARLLRRQFRDAAMLA